MGCVVSFTRRPFCLLGNSTRYPSERTMGKFQGRHEWSGEKNLSMPDIKPRFPGCPTHNLVAILSYSKTRDLCNIVRTLVRNCRLYYENRSKFTERNEFSQFTSSSGKWGLLKRRGGPAWRRTYNARRRSLHPGVRLQPPQGRNCQRRLGGQSVSMPFRK